MPKNNFAEFEYKGVQYKLKKIENDTHIIRMKDYMLIGIYTKRKKFYVTENGQEFDYAEDAQNYIIDKYLKEQKEKEERLSRIEKTNYKHLPEKDLEERRTIVIKRMFEEQDEIKNWRWFANKYDLFFMDEEEFFPKYDKYNL